MARFLLPVIAGTLVVTTLAVSDQSTAECDLGCDYDEVINYTGWCILYGKPCSYVEARRVSSNVIVRN
jgi:hypothetical protein